MGFFKGIFPYFECSDSGQWFSFLQPGRTPAYLNEVLVTLILKKPSLAADDLSALQLASLTCLVLVGLQAGVCMCPGWSVDGSLESGCQVPSPCRRSPGRATGRDLKYTTAPQSSVSAVHSVSDWQRSSLSSPETSAPNPPGVCVCVLGGEPEFWLPWGAAPGMHPLLGERQRQDQK